jgi:putative FmdB family regulatory protein
MPIYEYECQGCQKVHEIIQKFSDAPLETCPDCGGTVSKIMSMSSFSLKGSGWYTTDYKKAGKAAPASVAGTAAAANSTDGSAATPAPAATAAASPATSASPVTPSSTKSA